MAQASQVLVINNPGFNGPWDIVEAELKKRGFSVTRCPSRQALIEDREALANAEVVLAFGIPFGREVMALMPRLRAVVSPVIGTDWIDEEAATELGIIVANGQFPEHYQSLAEANVMLMLVCLCDLHAREAILRHNLPRPPHPTGRMMAGKLIGMIGFGHIARAIEERLHGWQVQIQTYIPRAPRVPLPPGVERVALDELMRTSDIINVLCPLNEETRGMINAELIDLMKPDAILINTARGGIVDEQALYEAARDKRIGKIAMDVFAVEPLPVDSPLRKLDNAILTSHMIGHSREARARVPYVAAENVSRILLGTPPAHVRNPEVIPQWLSRWGKSPKS